MRVTNAAPRAIVLALLGALPAMPVCADAVPADAEPSEQEVPAEAAPSDEAAQPAPGDAPTRAERPEPPGDEPVPGIEPAPSPAALRPVGTPPAFRGPDVTLIAGEERMIHEYRQNGQLRMIKVVPKRGKPYYLVPRDPTRGGGDLEQATTLMAEWAIWEF